MLNYYAIYDKQLQTVTDDELKNSNVQPIWIDIIDPSEEEEKLIACIFNVDISKNGYASNIKLPSCYYQQQGEVCANINIAIDDQTMHNVSIILTKEQIITTQSAGSPESKEYLNYLLDKNPNIVTSNSIFAYLIEARITDIEDAFKKATHTLDKLSQDIFYTEKNSKPDDVILEANVNQIGKIGHLISKHKESLVSIQRALKFIAKSEQIKLSSEEREKFTDLIDSVHILEEQISFLNSKMDFLLNINFGLINIQQNAITKTLSIAALIFLPPAIVAGIFGMNFENAPLISWKYGFITSIVISILSAIIPFLFCKLKRWI